MAEHCESVVVSETFNLKRLAKCLDLFDIDSFTHTVHSLSLKVKKTSVLSGGRFNWDDSSRWLTVTVQDVLALNGHIARITSNASRARH
ncbi:hypothetical protein Ciccas_001867 [Cichlidogyrus casuarinus]|uniref:Uncharacterized protein n=1 Tax=Cichlidogyrus casuarinus TaxID=1844966 RepID=A0ABD2QIY8_9PLAT